MEGRKLSNIVGSQQPLLVGRSSDIGICSKCSNLGGQLGGQLRWATCKHCWFATAAAGGGEEWRNLERGENTKGMPLIQPPQADKEAQKQTNKQSVG